EHYREIEHTGDILDVKRVVAQLLHRVFERRAVAVLDLGPAGDPRLDRVPLLVERDLLRELLDEKTAFRARPHEAHVAAQDVVELRQLVEARLADEAADAGDAIVAGLRPEPLGAPFSVLAR